MEKYQLVNEENVMRFVFTKIADLDKLYKTSELASANLPQEVENVSKKSEQSMIFFVKTKVANFRFVHVKFLKEPLLMENY